MWVGSVIYRGEHTIVSDYDSTVLHEVWEARQGTGNLSRANRPGV